MSFDFVAVASYIATLSIPGVTIVDADNIPISLETRLGSLPLITPALAPQVSNLTIKPITFGAAKACYEYRGNIDYFYFQSKVGTGRNVMTAKGISAIATNMQLFELALRADTTLGGTVVDFTVTTAYAMIIEDRAGQPFLGGKLVISFLDWDD